MSPADYRLFLKALAGGFGLESREALQFLCQKLWLKSLDEAPTFNHIVAQHVEEEIATFKIQEARKKAPESQSKKADKREPEIRPKSKQKEALSETAQEQDKPQAQLRTKEEGPMVTLSVEDVPVGEQAGSKFTEKHTRPEERFILSGSYLTLKQRDAETAWRFLRQNKVRTKRQQIDIAKTIQHVARKGYFEAPVFKFNHKSKASIYVLIDHQGSMVAFKTLGQAIVTAANTGGRIQVKTAYFKNVPGKIVFEDWYHAKSVPLQDFLNKASSEAAALLIISDAGAARGRYNDERVDATEDFYLEAIKKVKQIAWLNPLPKKRWQGTSAQYIAEFLPMFEATQQGLVKAIDVMRNKIQ